MEDEINSCLAAAERLNGTLKDITREHPEIAANMLGWDLYRNEEGASYIQPKDGGWPLPTYALGLVLHSAHESNKGVCLRSR